MFERRLDLLSDVSRLGIRRAGNGFELSIEHGSAFRMALSVDADTLLLLLIEGQRLFDLRQEEHRIRAEKDLGRAHAREERSHAFDEKAEAIGVRFQALRNDGLSRTEAISQIAEETGDGQFLTGLFLRRHNQTRRAQRDAQIVAEKAQGRTNKAIAEGLHISPATVAKVLSRHGRHSRQGGHHD